MSTPILQQTIKVEAKHERKLHGFVDMETGQPVTFLRDSGVRIEMNLTRNGALVDVSNILTATLEIKQTSARNGTLAMSKAIAPGSGIDATLTDADHAAKTPGRAHFTFEFSDSESASSVFGGSPADDIDAWAVVYGTVQGSASRVILATGQFKSAFAGVSGAVVSPPSGQAVSYAEVLALMANFVPYEVPEGKVVRFNGTFNGKKCSRTIGMPVDATDGPMRQDDIEIES